MHLTDHERQIVAELERQFDPAPATVDPPAATAAASTSDRGGRGGPARRLAGPAGLLGAVLLGAGLVLTVLSSTLLGALLVGWWLVARHGHRLKAAPGLLVEAGESAAAAQPGLLPAAVVAGLRRPLLDRDPRPVRASGRGAGS